MRSFFRIMLLALILVLVAVVSALTAMRFAIHGREAVVPKLVGLTPVEARRVAADKGLLLAVENRFYSSEVAEGRIVSQVPQAGERVRRGWQVRVAESLGPQRHIIPSVVGESERAAEINIRRRGLDVGTVAVISIPGAEAEQVVAQSPSANASGASSPQVNLLVAATDATPEFVMPDLTGRHLADAAKVLADAGLQLGKVQDTGPPGPGSTVIVRHSPAAGQKVTPGTVVNVDVSR
jgi:beta-lactam-binding protein with PASTA domain